MSDVGFRRFEGPWRNGLWNSPFSILYGATFKNDPFGVQGLWWKGHGLIKWLEHLLGKGYKVVYSNRVGGPTQESIYCYPVSGNLRKEHEYSSWEPQ